MKIFFLLTLLVSSSLFAQTRTFCERSRSDILSLMKDPSARISFKNSGGLINGGVCWWHNRLQRSSYYLVQFNPSAERPNPKELSDILTKLRSMNSIVTIPGFENFSSFTTAYRPQIQKMLNDWQVIDGVFHAQWIRGISGRPFLPASEMSVRMDAVYQSYRQSPAALWLMAQMEGITSHSFLVFHMEKVNGGYDLDLIDSNHPLEIVKVRYQEGDQTLRTDRFSNPFVPYAGFQEDFRRISKTLSGHCRDKNMAILEDFRDITDGEIELPKVEESQDQ